VSGDQQDSVDSAGQLEPAACNLDGQQSRHGPATALNEFFNNKLCHYGVYFVEFHMITKILPTLRKITKKIFNYQKSQKNREILPKVIKITKSGHTVASSSQETGTSAEYGNVTSKGEPVADLRHRIKIHIEGPLTSEALKFLSSRMSHYACWPPFS
jgi:hypothetical protein